MQSRSHVRRFGFDRIAERLNQRLQRPLAAGGMGCGEPDSKATVSYSFQPVAFRVVGGWTTPELRRNAVGAPGLWRPGDSKARSIETFPARPS